MDEPAGCRGTVRSNRNITARLVRERPDDLIRTLASDDTATGFDRPDVISKAANSWIGADPNAMGEWLKENAQVPYYDGVAIPFVKHIRAVDPEAASAWAATIKNPGLRQQAESTGEN